MKTFKIFALLMIVALSLSACGSRKDTLTDVVWQWASMQETMPPSQSVVPQPADYTITFNEDGTVDIQADCNRVAGTYTTNDDKLTIEIGPSTRMACADGSQDQIFLASLGRVGSYDFKDDQLQLKFADDTGKMDFNNGGSASESE